MELAAEAKLTEAVGSDSGRLVGELEKLYLYSDGKQERGRRRVPGWTSKGRASASVPIAVVAIMPAWRVAARTILLYSASWVISSWTTITT